MRERQKDNEQKIFDYWHQEEDAKLHSDRYCFIIKSSSSDTKSKQYLYLTTNIQFVTIATE